MALRDYKPATRVFPFEGGSFEVRGLPLPAFTALIRTHLADMEAMFDLGEQTLSGKVELDDTDLMKLVVAFVEQAPGLIANVIALAANEDSQEGRDAAVSLPFPLQVQVILAIVDLTFKEVGGIKKAWESVAGLLKNTRAGQAIEKVLKAP